MFLLYEKKSENKKKVLSDFRNLYYAILYRPVKLDSQSIEINAEQSKKGRPNCSHLYL